MKKLLPLFAVISLTLSGAALAQNPQQGYMHNSSQHHNRADGSQRIMQGYHQGAKHNQISQNRPHYNGKRGNAPRDGYHNMNRNNPNRDYSNHQDTRRNKPIQRQNYSNMHQNHSERIRF